jgi:hypothetical protein
MDIVRITFNESGDPLYGLYVDGKYIIGGDYYHDKAEYKIEGFLAGLRYANVQFDYRECICIDDEINQSCADCADIPETLNFEIHG